MPTIELSPIIPIYTQVGAAGTEVALALII